MQLIEQYHDLYDAQDVAMELRRRGILTHISSKHSHNMSGYITGTFRVGLWAVLDSQYKDACAFVLDRNHEITTGLAEKEIQRIEAQAKQSSTRLFSRFINLVLAGLVILAAAVFVLIKSNQAP